MTKLSRREMVTVGAWALAFLVAHLVGYTLPDVQQTITVWPAAGVGLAALLLSPRALWPWLLSAFVVVGIGGDVAIAHRPFAAAVGYMTANFVEATASALLIRRVGGRNIRFDRVAPVVALLGSAFGVNAISACIGAGSSALAAHGVFGDAWRTWYVADALGILLVTPLIIGWARVHDLGEADASARPGRTVESVAFFGVWCVLAWYAFSPSAGSAVRPYVLVALLPWPAFRLRPLVVPTALVLLALVFIGDAVWNPGATALAGRSLAETLLNIQLFLAVTATLGLLLAASYAETSAARVVLAKSAASLKVTERQLSMSQEIGGTGTWVLDIQANKIWGSVGGTNLFRLPAGEGQYPIAEIEACIPDRERVSQALRDLISEERKYDLEYLINPADGSPARYVRSIAQLARDADGIPRSVLGFVHDITDRKQAQDALIAQVARYRTLTDNLQIGVLIQGANAEIMMSNRKALELLGLTEDQLLGRTSFDPDWNVIHEDGTLFPGPTHPVPQALATRTRVHDVVMGVYRPAIRDRVWLLVTANPQLNADGTVREVVCTFADLTAQRAMEAERAQFAAQLHHAQKMESVGRLAGGVAHDYNNMLAVILGHTELALQADTSAAVRDDLTTIHQAATHSAEITRQLLAFARKQVIRPQRLDLNATVAHALQMLRPLIGERVQVTWHPAAELWPVAMDVTQLEQILTNLCLNARDAIRDVGTLVVTTANRVVDATLCETLADAVPGDYVQLTVTDSGRGMSRDALARIFEPFYTTKGLGEGTGLGLASVYGAVRQNGGFVGVASVEGEGTTFDICFPRSEGTLAGPRASEPAAPLERGHQTILVVEDEAGVRRMTVRALERQGYTVLAAEGPREAIRLAQERGRTIALVLTDVQMPEMSGHDLAATLRSVQPHMKHLFMSGFPIRSSEGDGQREDAANFLAKPFTLAALTGKVRGMLDGE